MFFVLQLQDFFFDGVAADEFVGGHDTGLADAVGAVGGLGFDGGVPPGIEVDDGVDGGEIEANAPVFELIRKTEMVSSFGSGSLLPADATASAASSSSANPFPCCDRLEERKLSCCDLISPTKRSLTRIINAWRLKKSAQAFTCADFRENSGNFTGV